VPADPGPTFIETGIMEELLTQMANTARSTQDVVDTALEDGMHLLVYPYEQGLLVGLGYGADQAHRVDMTTVLRVRGQHLERVGAWLPARFADGSAYVVRRVPDAGDGPVLSEQELMAGRELLA
jgi:hypothetical protein